MQPRTTLDPMDMLAARSATESSRNAGSRAANDACMAPIVLNSADEESPATANNDPKIGLQQSTCVNTPAASADAVTPFPGARPAFPKEYACMARDKEKRAETAMKPPISNHFPAARELNIIGKNNNPDESR